MFAAHCPACARPVLLGVDRIVRLRTGQGQGHHDVTLRCRCGTTVRWRSPRATSVA